MRKKKLLTALLSVAMLIGVTAAATACGDTTGNEQSTSSEVSLDTPATSATIKFDVNTTFATNLVKDKVVSIGKRVSRPKVYISDENPDNLQVYGWYKDAACTEPWDFKNDRVEGDMTLYAKWVEQYTVSYYVNGALVREELVFKGDKVEEDASLVEGFKYLGSYLDSEYTSAFDYNNPIAGNTALHIKRSAGIYMSDHTEEGELPSSSLSDYLVAYIGSTSTDASGNIVESEGWVESYDVITEYPTGAVEEKCTYVNFGYQPKYGDGYVELCLALDITQSQTIRVWFKNLGKAAEVNAYFTAMLDAENNIYSETGATYTQDFCYPNYTGSGVGSGIALRDDQIEMAEEAEWTYVDFNFYEVYKNGYSIWGTSPYLATFRFQVNYKNENEDDWSNVFLIKAIEGIAHEVVVEDSGEVQQALTDAANTSEQTLEAVSAEQAEDPQGLVFPKNRNTVTGVNGDAQVLQTSNGLLFHANNEVAGRAQGNPSSGFTLTVPDEKVIDLSDLTTLEITLRNYGYAGKITVRIYNNIGIPVTADIAVAQRMKESKTYTANLYGKYGMEGTLSKIEIVYKSVGVDNALLIENIQMSEFMPYDSVGVNLNDKYCFGLASTDKVDVSFESNRSGTLFKVSESGATVTSADRTYKGTTDGYGNAVLQYYLYPDSNVTAVSVAFKINGEFTSDYVYALDTEQKGINNSVSVPLKRNERGSVEAIRLTFEGTGRVLLKSIDYTAGETGLPFYESYNDIYKTWDWEITNTYEYDSVLKASIFKKDPTKEKLSAALYIGISQLMSEHLSIPHTTQNVLLTGVTEIKIVYQNKTDVNTLDFTAGFTNKATGNPDEGNKAYAALNFAIDSQMADYEWSTATIVIPTEYIGSYLGKVHLGFLGKEIAIRMISIETGV